MDQLQAQVKEAMVAGDLRLIVSFRNWDDDISIAILTRKDLPVDALKAALIQVGFGLQSG